MENFICLPKESWGHESGCRQDNTGVTGGEGRVQKRPH